MSEENLPLIPTATSSPSPETATTGLAKRMNQVSRLLTITKKDLSEKATHDLRVAIRRCRSVAYNIAPLDPEGPWRCMSKELRRIFRALGHLRDLHVLQQWTDKLGTHADRVRHTVTAILREREPRSIQGVKEALHRFDKDRWVEWEETLPRHLTIVLTSHPLFEDLARQRFQTFLSSAQGMTDTNAEETWHQARVALKRFRYTVESFLPDLSRTWEKDIASLQDIMGEIHDLDVLHKYLLSLSPLFEPSERQRWQLRIQKERRKRVRLYQQAMKSPDVPWREWEKGLGGSRSITSWE